MPKYEITAPDGKRYEVTAPEGATEQQALEHFKSQYTATPAKSIYEQQAAKQSGVENFLAGAGGGMVGLYLGAKQRLGLADQKEIDDHRAAMEGLRSTKSGIAGDLTGSIAAGLPLALVPGINTYTGATLAGAAMGGLQPTKANEHVSDNMLVGAVGGAAGKFLSDKLVRLLRGKNAPALSGNPLNNTTADEQLAMQSVQSNVGLNDDMERILRRAQAMGFKATPGQAAGSKTLQKFEAALSSNPFTAGAFDDIKTHNASLMNSIGAKAIGEQGDSVSSTVLEQAKDRISDVYKRVADKNLRSIDAQDFVTRFGQINDEFEGLLPSALHENPVVKRLIDFASSGQATGEQLQTIASKLGGIAHKNMVTQGGDRDTGIALFRVKDMVDDYLSSGLSAENKKLFADARGQYRNMMLMTQRAGVVNPASGDLSGSKLASVLASKDKSGYTFNKNHSELYDAARFADAFRPLVGDSGTATRSMQNLSLESLAKLPFGLVARLYASQPVNNLAGMYGHTASRGLAPSAGQALAPWVQTSAPFVGAQGLLNVNKE